MKTVAWHHIRCDIPDEWEVPAYSIEPRQGRLEFSTRRGFQALIGWEQCKRLPDADTMMIGFLRRHIPATKRASTASLDNLQTRTLNGYTLGLYPGMPVQALSYLKDDGILLNWVFEAGDPEHITQVIEPVLRSCRCNTTT